MHSLVKANDNYIVGGAGGESGNAVLMNTRVVLNSWNLFR